MKKVHYEYDKYISEGGQMKFREWKKTSDFKKLSPLPKTN